MLAQRAQAYSEWFTTMKNCSSNGLAETLVCYYIMPHCSGGKRVYPCKRVCSEFLKQCEGELYVSHMEFIIRTCHALPDSACFEPPNFSTNDSVKGPLERGCQKLIIPACKNLAVSQHTLVTADDQKHWYRHAYHKYFKEEKVETDFPPDFLKVLAKYPKCQENLKKMFCGENFPPCFPGEDQGHYSICKSVCDDILRDCPEFFRDDFIDAEYCALLGKGNTSHGYCKRSEWPPPFSWARYMVQGRASPTDKVPSKTTEGVKVWPIAVSVVVTLIFVGLIVLGAICMKWRRNRVPRFGYKKQQEDMAPLETSAEL